MHGCAAHLPESSCSPRPWLLSHLILPLVYSFNKQESMSSCVPDDTVLGSRAIKMSLGGSFGRVGGGNGGGVGEGPADMGRRPPQANVRGATLRPSGQRQG